jgi:hypothetical protein
MVVYVDSQAWYGGMVLNPKNRLKPPQEPKPLQPDCKNFLISLI